MERIAEAVAEAGGVLRTRDLKDLGARERDLTHAVRSGQVRRARRGWYTTFEADDPRFVALRVGGRLTGASALALLGAWMWSPRPRPTVSVPSNAARLRHVSGVRTVYDRESVTSRGSYWAVDPRDALVRAVREAPFEEAVTLWDWALSSTYFSENDLAEVAKSLPADARRITTWADDGSESFLESIARVRLQQEGYTVTTQEPVGRNQSIDLLVEGVVGIELDGFEFHANTFDYDRTKDLAIVSEGRTPLRLSYTMVKRLWSRILRAVEQAVLQHRSGAEALVRPIALARRRKPRGSRPWSLAS